MKHIQNMIGYIPKSDLQVVFTSLHGTSVPIVPELLQSLNFIQFNLVEAQCKPDPNFSSVHLVLLNEMHTVISHILMATKLVRCYLIIVFNKRLNYVTA